MQTRTVRKAQQNCEKLPRGTPPLWYGQPSVRIRTGNTPALVATVVAGALVAGLLPALGDADTAPALRAKADALRSRSTSLESRSHDALLQLYAAESALARARSEVARLGARSDALSREQTAVGRRVEVVRRSLAASRARVAALLRELYVRGDADPIAVILGAASLEEAIEGIDSLRRLADRNRRLATQAKARAESLRALQLTLAERGRRLAAARADAEVGAAQLERRLGERAVSLASLRAQGTLTRRQLSALETQARAAEQISAKLAQKAVATAARPSPQPARAPAPTTAPTTAPSPAAGQAETDAANVAPTPPLAVEGERQEPPAPVSTSDGTRTLVVDAVAYHLPGRTASGLPVGIGVVAVDPTVIPLGTRMLVPGYGPAVAADVGSAVKGNIIDLWHPSTAQALAWGRRTITITIYG